MRAFTAEIWARGDPANGQEKGTTPLKKGK